MTAPIAPVPCAARSCSTVGQTVHDLAAQFNQSCFCVTLDRAALADALGEASGDPAFYDAHIKGRLHLFSNVPVFLPRAEGDAMMAIVAAIERTAQLREYQQAVLGWAPEVAAPDFGPLGAFMGYDFHLGDSAPRLIEINTNAGGALLNAFSARAQLVCCNMVEPLKEGTTLGDFDTNVVAMFESEWRRQRGAGRPRTIAIIDDQPEQQYLYPEFLLMKRLFAMHGIASYILDPSSLSYADGALRFGDKVIDLVYNRLVDFALSDPQHEALRAAYLAGAAVVTPNPHNHALFAHKRNLTLLSDPETLRRWSLPADAIDRLSSIPRAVEVSTGNADQLWSDRKRLFFKPVAGHGGKAVYRGDKLTRAVWAEITASDYIAQDLAPPTERQVLIDGAAQPRKLDVRLYTYAGTLLLAAARLYQGQTTNFRTEGGGFAPVYFI